MTYVHALIFEYLEEPAEVEVFKDVQAAADRLSILRFQHPNHESLSCGGLMIPGEFNVYYRKPEVS